MTMMRNNMIYTLTFSPAIDLSLKIDNINLGEINTMNDYSIKAGGKGINVSFALVIQSQMEDFLQ